VSVLITWKLLENELTVRFASPPAVVDVPPAAPVVDVDELDLELLQAASPAVVSTATVKTVTRLRELVILPPLTWCAVLRASRTS
jgi:hypothetical protein